MRFPVTPLLVGYVEIDDMDYVWCTSLRIYFATTGFNIGSSSVNEIQVLR